MSESEKDSFSDPPTGAPNLESVAQAMKELCITIAWLRDPVKGCPWDLKQTHASLRRYMLEESYEAVEAMHSTPNPHMVEELGDVLLQVVLNAQVGLDQGSFSLEDVIHSINKKMRRRHPHVFHKNSQSDPLNGDDDVKTTWKAIKAEEKLKNRNSQPSPSIFDEAKTKYPALLQAHKIGQIAAEIDFDWDSPLEVFQQLCSEVDELKEELKQSKWNMTDITAEIGDIYFSLAQLCRHLGLDPEITALDGNHKFLSRFAQVERMLSNKGLNVRSIGRGALEFYWSEAKAIEKKNE